MLFSRTLEITNPRTNPKTKRVLERSILGTVEEFEDMAGNGRGNRRRSFQPRNSESQKVDLNLIVESNL